MVKVLSEKIKLIIKEGIMDDNKRIEKIFIKAFKMILTIFVYVLFLLIIGYQIYIFSNVFSQTGNKMIINIILGDFIIFMVLSYNYYNYLENEGKKDKKDDEKTELS